MVTAREYKATALANARSGSLDALTVAGYGYAQTATLAGVTLKDGNSPATFFYASIRRYVAQTLAAEGVAAAREVRRAAFETAIKKLAGEADTNVTIDDEGNLQIAAATLGAGG
jgi:hypothetical protein